MLWRGRNFVDTFPFENAKAGDRKCDRHAALYKTSPRLLLQANSDRITFRSISTYIRMPYPYIWCRWSLQTGSATEIAIVHREFSGRDACNLADRKKERKKKWKRNPERDNWPCMRNSLKRGERNACATETQISISGLLVVNCRFPGSFAQTDKQNFVSTFRVKRLKIRSGGDRVAEKANGNLE